MEKESNKNNNTTGKDQELLGRFDNISIIVEDPEFKKEPTQQEAIDTFWTKYKRSNHASTRDSKMRINKLEFQDNNLIVFLSQGIDFADIMYTDNIYTKNNSPTTPKETYYTDNNGALKTHDCFANAASVGAIIEFYDGHEPVFIFNIRAKQATEPGTISLPLNGFVDAIEKSSDLLIDNLYKETMEEILIKNDEIGSLKFIGPAQTRGRGCDFIWLMQPKLELNDWISRWQKSTIINESSGVIICKKSELDSFFSLEEKNFLPNIIYNNQAKNFIEKNKFKLNPLIKSLEDVIKTLK